VWKSICIVVAAIIFGTGCQRDATISDPDTKIKIELVEQLTNQIIIQISNDEMLGYDDYAKKKLVIDPNYYVNNEIKRGDVVYFAYPKNVIESNLYIAQIDKQILRVVGLSEERIRMEKGKIFINGKRLDSFYGSHVGYNLKDLKKKLKEPDLHSSEIENIENAINYIENENMEEVLIPKGMVFLMGDNRARALDSRFIGPIPIDNIIGKLIGAVK